MKKLLSILLLLLITSTCFSQSNGIFGITTKAVSPGIFFSKIDPATGKLQLVSNTSFGTSYSSVQGIIDEINKIYYFETVDTPKKPKLIGIDINTGNLKSSSLIRDGNGITYSLYTFGYNPFDSLMYGLINPSASQFLLVKANPLTGIVNIISNSSVASAYLGSGIINAARKEFYLPTNGVSGAQFRTIDITTGDVIDSPDITNPTGKNFMNLAFNSKDSTIYGLIDHITLPEFFLAKINPHTGIITKISNSFLGTNVLLAGSTIDTASNTFYYVQDSVNKYSIFTGVDLTTGNLVSRTAITPDSITRFAMFCYTNASKPTSISTNYLDPLSIYPNPANNTVFIKAPQKADYTVELINPEGQVMYSGKMKNADNLMLNISAYAAGNYFIRLQNDKASYTKRLTITN